MGNKHKVLVIDDEEAICNSIETFLRFEGYEAQSCTDSIQAVEMAKETDYQIMFADLSMPKMDGLEFLKEVKKLRPATQVVIMTGFVTRKKIMECFQEGAVDCIMKPFKDLSLIKTMADEMSARLSRWDQLLGQLPD